MRWWGWGEDGHDVGAARARAGAAARRARGSTDAPGRRPSRSRRCGCRRRALDGAARARLAAVVGEEHVRDDRAARVEHAAGRSYPDLVRLRSGRPAAAPDAVVAPGVADEVRALLAACAAARVAVVPFGGGTSVVGGVEPLRDGFAAVISLDLRRLDRVCRASTARSLTATLEAGLFGPAGRAAAAPSAGSRSGTSRSRSSSRPSAAGWRPARPARPPPATGASTSWSRACGCVAPAGELEPPRGARDGGRAGRCASCWSARRACWA